MNDFYDLLEKKDLLYTLTGAEWKKIMPINAGQFIKAIREIVTNNLSVYIDPDCDPDGYISALEIKEMFDRLKYKNYTVGKHYFKRHVVTINLAQSIISKHFDVTFLLDSSSNSMDVINKLCENGIKTIIVDHHDTDYVFENYPKNCIIINPTIDAKYGKTLYSKLSAGAICSLLVDCTLKSEFQIDTGNYFYLLGYVTLYSDACDLRNEYNVAYLKKFRGIAIGLPPLISLFMNKYTSFNRNFISYTMIPRINALIRDEHFDFVWQLFFDIQPLLRKKEETLEYIESVYRASKDYVIKLCNQTYIDEHDNFVLGIMNRDMQDENQKARNYTGLVANNIAGKCNKLTIILYDMHNMEYEGSVRDPLSRNVLPIFQNLFYAQGHPPAFGIKFPKLQLENNIMCLDSLSKSWEKNLNSLLLVDWNETKKSHDDINSEIISMAEYSEYGGQGLPACYGVKTIGNDCKLVIKRSTRYVSWCGFTVVIFNNYIKQGDLMFITPTLDGAGFKLLCNNVRYL